MHEQRVEVDQIVLGTTPLAVGTAIKDARAPLAPLLVSLTITSYDFIDDHTIVDTLEPCEGDSAWKSSPNRWLCHSLNVAAPVICDSHIIV